jgi:hypothetical protein
MKKIQFFIILAVVTLPLIAFGSSLKVTSFPDGAQVWINDVYTGKITPVNIQVTDGATVKVIVQIPNSGWAKYESMIPINPGNNDLSVTLLPILTAGPMGPAGPAGPTGATGPQGLKGDIGAQGPAGPTGLTGPMGPKGETGTQGPMGPQGPSSPLMSCLPGQVLVSTEAGWQCGSVALLQNAIGLCYSSGCLLTCSPGWGDCDHNAANGCETDITIDKCGCINLVKDGDETDVDCGGSCIAKCSNGKACVGNSDCNSRICINNICVAPPAPPSCTDRIKNGGETDVDCGGGVCNPCANGNHCNTNFDCGSGNCSIGVCTAGIPPITCSPGWGDCDNNAANGCETNITNNSQNCGSCGNKCASNELCTNGKCVSSSTPNTGLYTSLNHIYTLDGNIWQGRGANLMDTRSCNACAYQKPNVDEVKRRIDELVDIWKADFIRLNLESYGSADGRDPNNWASVLADSNYIENIKSIVRYIGTKPNVYVMVSLWVDPSINNMGWPTSTTNTVWSTLVDALGDQLHVLFGVVNEPEYNFDGSQDPDVWSAMNSAVQTIRDEETLKGFSPHVIVVQGTRDWGRRLDYYITHPITAGGGNNIAYETQVYNPSADFKTLFEDPSNTLPVIIGQFGPNGMTEADCATMMIRADALKIPYLAWAFHMRCPPNLLEDYSNGGCGVGMALVPTSWGLLLKNHLTGL